MCHCGAGRRGATAATSRQLETPARVTSDRGARRLQFGDARRDRGAFRETGRVIGMDYIKKLGVVAVLGALGSFGVAGIAQASQAHPSPSSSCSILGSKAVYYTPKLHHRDLLTCQWHTTRSGTRKLWVITGH